MVTTKVDLRKRLIRLEEDQTKDATARVSPLLTVVANEQAQLRPKTGNGKAFDDTNLRTGWARACTTVGLVTIEKQESEKGNVLYR